MELALVPKKNTNKCAECYNRTVGGVIMFKETFCRNLKRAREEKQYTQQYVADKINTSRTNITKYENGTLEPNLETIGALAELYNVSADWLFGIKKTN